MDWTRVYAIHFDHEIPYREVRGKLLPLINMTFRIGDNEFHHPMLVDTGADHIALPAWSAAELGIRIQEDCTSVTAVSLGGYSELYQYPDLVTVELPDLDEHFGMQCNIMFSPGLDQRSHGLLGRGCTLHHLAFGFHESRNYHAFYLSLSPRVRAGGTTDSAGW